MNPAIIGVSDTIESDIPNYDTLSLDEKYFRLLDNSIHELCEFLLLDKCKIFESITDYITIEPSALGREGYGQSVRDANNLGLTGIQCHIVDLGGASVAASLGEADRIARTNPEAVVLIAGADVPKSAFQHISDLKRLTKTVSHPHWEIPYGATLIGMYSLLANHQMNEYSISQEDYVEITEYFREISKTNPRAFNYNKDLNKKILNKYLSPPYSSPMIAIVTDHGFATLIIGTKAREKWIHQGILKNTHPQLYIVGSAHCIHSEYFSSKGNLSTPAGIASDLAFSRSGYSCKDLEYAWIYDCFTGMIISQASAYFSENPANIANSLKKGKLAIEEKEIPINLGGGILNYQAAMSMSGATGLVDILSQYNLARYPIPNRLPSNPRLSLMGNNGGIDSINSVVLFSTEDKLGHISPKPQRIQKLTLNPIQEIINSIQRDSETVGYLLSYTTIFFNPGGDRKPPYILALIELRNKGFLMTNLYSSSNNICKTKDGLELGMPIILRYEEGEVRGYLP